jgi:hypothetical protein
VAVVALKIHVPVAGRTADLVATVRAVALPIAFPGRGNAVLGVRGLGAEAGEVIGSAGRRHPAVLAVVREHQRLGAGAPRARASADADVRAAPVLVEGAADVRLHGQIAGHPDGHQVRERPIAHHDFPPGARCLFDPLDDLTVPVEPAKDIRMR